MQAESLFGLTPDAGAAILKDIRDSILQWRPLASRNGLTSAEADRFAPIFNQGVTVLKDFC